MNKKREEPYILIMKTSSGVGIEVSHLDITEAIGLIEIAKASYIKENGHSFVGKEENKDN